jgi:hypothetical protein
MKNILLKGNNHPKKAGYYICIRTEFNHRPQLLEIGRNNLSGTELMVTGYQSHFPLSDLENEECLWSDEVELTEVMAFG